MSLDRRGFIGMLMAGTAGIVLPSDLLWQPQLDAALPLLRPGAIVGLNAMVLELGKQLGDMVGGRLADLDEQDRGLEHQFHAELMMLDDVDHYGLDALRYIRPIAEQLAGLISRNKVTKFGRLDLPEVRGLSACRWDFSTTGISVRGIAYRSVVVDDTLDSSLSVRRGVRFDVLAGT